MVITGLTRNQFAGNRTWVRIPPSPPKRDKTAGGSLISFSVRGKLGFERQSQQSGGLLLPPVRKLAATLQLRLAKLPESHRLRQRITATLIQVAVIFFYGIMEKKAVIV